MNERIQKLYKETTGKDWVYDFDPDYAGKFAEALIKEVLEQVRDEVQYEYDWNMADAITNRVRKHFGVE